MVYQSVYSLLISIPQYIMSDDLASVEAKIKYDTKRLKKVLSTKISKDDYMAFKIITNQAYLKGAIKEDSPSEMLRYILTPIVEGFRKLPEFSQLKDKPY
jgi:hypothetical protein